MTFFTGSDTYTVDSKFRVTVPAQYTSQLLDRPGQTAEGLTFFAVKYSLSGGKFKCIYLILPETFKDMAARMKEECGPILSPNDNMPTYTRLMASAKECRCDRQGRLIIPRKHLEYAQIDQSVMIVGLDDIIQLWKPSQYELYISEPQLSS
jgi:MraZ protein